METNVLYFGDNLEILRKYIPDNSIDLVYLDPPFNSKATYNLLYKERTGEPSQAQITAFEDTWHWSLESEKALQDIFASPLASPSVKDFMSVMPNFLGKKTDMAAYLSMMCVRLIELRRVLKDTGSIYLHCDPTASHYLKIVMDAIFGASSFRNEIVWKRMTPSGFKGKASIGNSHDVLLYYSKADDFLYNPIYVSYSDKYLSERFNKVDENGRRFKDEKIGTATSQATIDRLRAEGKIYVTSSGKLRIKHYLDEIKGVPLDDVWHDIPPINSQAAERLGYPTQKPETLLERIIKASSNEGDIVLDPFCGCGTALAVAQKLNRKWIGIDITHLAISTMKWRLEKMFPNIQYKVIGEPKDLAGAKELAKESKYQFQWWAVSLVHGQPYGDKKKGADTGIDGYLYFKDERDKVKKAIIQVKGGNVEVSHVRDLVGVVHREKAEMGLFLCLEPITKPMQLEAASEGFYHSPLGKDYPKIQILTIEQLLAEHKKPDIPPWVAPMDTPPIAKSVEGKTTKLI